MFLKILDNDTQNSDSKMTSSIVIFRIRTLIQVTLSITTLGIVILTMTTLSAKTLIIKTHRIATLSIT